MIKMMIVCVTSFSLSWLPMNCLIVIGDHNPEVFQYPIIAYLWFVCHWLAMSHACYNPIIYCWMNSKFRSGFKYCLRFLPCIRSDQRPDFLPQFSTATFHSHAATVRNNNVPGPIHTEITPLSTPPNSRNLSKRLTKKNHNKKPSKKQIVNGSTSIPLVANTAPAAADEDAASSCFNAQVH